ncbi:RING-H2 finger protein ATL46-like [Malania oleifera]|uniref:RING-H2 finger protein ATL46-like n=1 Tax=Malania oleifera TaxID=397392 RepID=UPI0025ADD15D|nr:RING-H2 finger protein ATL46-like [Malania oleifera]
MFFSACPFPRMPKIRFQTKQKDGSSDQPSLSYLLPYSLSSSSASPSSLSPYSDNYPKDSTPAASSGSKISPAVLFIIVILAVIFFISGLLHLLVRFLVKHRSSSSISQSNRYPEMSGPHAFQRQLQQLFHLHDSGLDQAFIDALPVFLYKEIKGLKEPFDCAVCLCEFSERDKLRLLPLCGHAFHIDCIDTWLLSNSSCPLCRGTLFTPGLGMESPLYVLEDSREEDCFPGNGGGGAEIVGDKRVFSVRLGKFRGSNDDEGGDKRVEGETSSSNLDARRCFSMGSFQYVVSNSNLQVALCHTHTTAAAAAGSIDGGEVKLGGERGEPNGNSSSIDGDAEGKKINIGSKGESFSVSKIWQWSKKGKFPSPSDTHLSSSYVNMGLSWLDRTQVT